MPARDGRTRPLRDAASGRRGRGAASPSAGSRSARERAGNVSATGRRNGEPVRFVPAPAVDGLVVGTVPGSARATGVLLLLAGLAGAIAPFPTYLVVGGRALSQASGVGAALICLVVPLTHLLVGAGLARGRVPKFGLAYAGVAGSLAFGQFLIEVYRGSSSTSRPAVEVLAGERVLTSSVGAGPGWVLGLLALALTVLAACVAAVAWGRTVMEDGGSLDAVRSGLAGAAVLLGVATVLCLSLPAADVPDRLTTDPVTGMQTVVTREGPQALLERPGLALLGGLLLAGAVVLCAVVAPSLRPRLAAVGGLLALAVVMLSAGLLGARDALHSPDLEWTLPGVGLVLFAAAYAGLAAVAWRIRRGRP
ncbi:MAG: hypothetical protein JWQ45_1438 [Blastococcus sp.]|nr:hypothetical protein [Blastococcus sp.]